MSIDDAAIETMQTLPPEGKQQLLEYARSLQQQMVAAQGSYEKINLRSHPAFGLWKDREDLNNRKRWREQIMNDTSS